MADQIQILFGSVAPAGVMYEADRHWKRGGYDGRSLGTGESYGVKEVLHRLPNEIDEAFFKRARQRADQLNGY